MNTAELQKTFRPITFTWKTYGKAKKIEVKDYTYEYDNNTRGYHKKDIIRIKKVYGEEITHSKNIYKDNEGEPIVKQLGSKMVSFIFIPSEDNSSLYVKTARIINNTKRGDEYVPEWYIDPNFEYFEVKRDKEIFKHLYMAESKTAKTRKIKFYQNPNVLAQKPEDIQKIFKSVFGENLCCKGMPVNFSQCWRIIDFLQYKPQNMSDKKKKLLSDIIEQIGEPQKININYLNFEPKESEENIFLDEYNGKVLLRYFNLPDKNGICTEISRQLKIKGKDTFFIYDNNMWKKMPRVPNSYWCQIIGITENLKNNLPHKIKLVDKYMQMSNESRRYAYVDKNFIINLLDNDVYEQILKICSEKLKEAIYKDYRGLSMIFGDIPNDGKSIYSKLGINKYQFNKINENYGNKQPISLLKNLFETNNISNLSNEITDFAFKEAECQNSVLYHYELRNLIKKYCNLKNIKTVSEQTFIKLAKYVSKDKLTSNYGWTSYPILGQLSDYYGSLLVLKQDFEDEMDISQYPLLPCQSQLVRYHDLASEKVNEIRAKINNMPFKISSESKKLEYSNNEYSIVLPTCSSEVLMEGATLHHCVGGYVDEIRSGRTNILFLRKNSNKNESFYTIEVKNGNIIQIHGKCNKYLGNDPEVIPFVVEWIKKNELKYNISDILSNGTSYGCRGQMIPNIYGI